MYQTSSITYLTSDKMAAILICFFLST